MGNKETTAMGEKVKDIAYFKNQGIQAEAQNFQITAEGTSKIFMKLEQASENIFNLEVANPFNVFQAYAIALSSFK